MKRGNNASDVSSTPGLFLLPIRAEKLLFPVTVAAADTEIVAAEQAGYEFIMIRIPGRGVDANGSPDAARAAHYQFLVNPHTLQINRQHLDAQSLAKGGWQFGLWGEDFITVRMEGKSPGRYYSNGLTAFFALYSASYRNLEALEILFENNGYWFEGEKPFDGPVASLMHHRQIKMHTDVELRAGEFIWKGMFDSFDVSETAEEPFLASFTLTFTAWQERYHTDTPYLNPIGGAVDRGHVTGAAATYQASGTGSPPAPLVAQPSPQSMVPATAEAEPHTYFNPFSSRE